VAIAIANPLLGEHVTTWFFLGASLVFVGIFIAEGRIHYHPLHLLRRKENEIP
jgi:drug/metabolite transporter (DMT)-like permease